LCRLFGAVSVNKIDANGLLRSAPQSLLSQSHVDRKRKQGDGWGIGWFERGQPRIFKSPKPIYRDQAALRRAAFRARGKVLVGHVRWASNPLKLKRSELIGPVHTQPFAHDRWLFAHNGTLLIPREVRARLGPLAKHIKGNNDSEVLFYWLMKHWKTGNVMKSIRKSIRGLHQIWGQCRSRYPIFKHPYHGLNWVLTNGQTLIALCAVNPAGFGKAKALCSRQQPYYQLQYKHDGDGLVVASEPLDGSSSWKPMRHGEVLIADKAGVRHWML
jgi:predicted glutamine amidotransferase